MTTSLPDTDFAASRDRLRTIAGRARTFHERLEEPLPGREQASGAPPPVADDGDVTVEELFEDWRAALGADAFEERLDELGLDGEACRQRLDSHAWPDGEPLPDWIDRLDDVVESVSARRPGTVSVPDDRATSVPFADVTRAVVEYASDCIDWTLAGDSVGDEGRIALENVLGDRLSNVCAHALFVEFKTYLADRDPELAFAEAPSVSGESRRHYESFCARLFERDHLLALLEEYALLARLVATLVDQWIDATTAFLERLAADRPALGRLVDGVDELGPVTDVTVGGDPHAGGHSTTTVTFGEDARVVYKPRPVGPAAGFGDLVDWLSCRWDGPALQTPSVVERDGYGWVEWVPHEPCSEAVAVERYFRRAGGLVTLLYALRFSDGHLENVVASGDHPMVIDLETLAQPRAPGEDRPDHVADTVLETGLLPRDVNGDSRRGDSGFGAGSVTFEGAPQANYSAVNTDAMELSFERDASLEGRNRPYLDGEPVQLDRYVDELWAGVESAHECLRRHRGELLAPDGPLSAFAGTEIRTLFRSTEDYGRILERYTREPSVRTGLRVGPPTERLARRHLATEPDPVDRSVFRAELRALRVGDVPRFTTAADGRALRRAGEPVDDEFFVQSGLELVRERIAGLDEADLAVQRDALQLSVVGVTDEPEYGMDAPPTDRDPAADAVSTATVTSRSGGQAEEVLRRAAGRIFGRLLDRARVDEDGAPTWTLRHGTPAGATGGPIGNELYAGRVGVALFGAAMYRTFGGQPYRRFAEDVAAPVVASVRDGSVARSGMLGHAGSGSVAYGLAALAELLDQDVYRDAALAAAEAIDREAVEADDRIDVVDGSAGALLGLCKCHEVTGAGDPLERAVVAGDHLLEGADVRDGRPVWTTGDRDRPLQGFAHGVAGIAYALSRLGDLTDEPRYGRVARESVAFEDELYDHDRHNWRDVRAETDAFTSSWCHGRAGIGLARLGLARHTSDSAPARDVTCALAGTDHERVLDRDHVCCGNFGRVGWLAAAADWRDDPSTRDRAVELAARVARRARRNERFLGPYQTERLYDPTFFTGEAGVGYVCCRLLNPELPSVLLAE